MNYLKCFFQALFLFSLVSCSAPQEKSEAGAEEQAVSTTLVVYASNYPLQYFARRIAGPFAEVRFPASGAGDPAYWAPAAEEIAAMQEADLILLNGATYEQWLKNVSLPESRLVNTTGGLEDRLIEEAGAVTHSHGDEGEHTHAGTAFTTWLDLSLAAEQARAVMNALIERLPAEETQLQRNFATLEADLLALDTGLKELTADSETTVFFSHPVYQYLQRRYNIDGHSVHFEPGQAPDASAMKDFRHELEHHPAGWMIWEAKPIPETRTTLEELGVQSVVFNPCANAPESGDFLSVMRENIERMRPVFAQEVE